MLPPASAKFPFERLACEELAGIGIARNVEFRLRFVLAPEPIFLPHVPRIADELRMTLGRTIRSESF